MDDHAIGTIGAADPIPLVRTSAFIPFMAVLERIGAPIERRLAEVMLPGDLLSEPESLIPLNQALLFLEKNAHAEGVEDLGLLAGRETHIAQLGAFGRLIVQSLTLYDAITKISQAIYLYNSAQRVWLDSWRGQARVCNAYGSHVGRGRQYGDQFSLMLLIDCIRLAAGPRWLPTEIHLESSLWDLLGKRPDAFGGVPISRQKVSGIVFDRKLLSAPLDHARPARKNAAEIEYQALVATAPALDFPDSIRQVVRMFLKDGHYQIGRIASAAGVSVRTLQRRLAESGVDYSALVDRARFDMATSLLKERKAKLIDIAYDLGYSDAASFTRAFRRWTGTAPSEFRHSANVD